MLSVLTGPIIERDSADTAFSRIEAACRVHSDRPAVIFGDDTVTYAELASRAEGLAGQLIQSGVKAGTLVPILTSGGIDMITSMLGIWKTGAAFVPMDIATPPERLNAMLANVSAPCAVVDRDGVPPDLLHSALIRVGDETASVSREQRLVTAEDLAYGFFTSGSTGIPKCCLNVHRGLVNRFAVMTDMFDLAPGDNVLQNSKHIFDSSLWQILWPLCVGASVVVPRRSGLLDIELTLEVLRQHRIVMTDFVPSILDVLLERQDLVLEDAERLLCVV